MFTVDLVEILVKDLAIDTQMIEVIVNILDNFSILLLAMVDNLRYFYDAVNFREGT